MAIAQTISGTRLMAKLIPYRHQLTLIFREMMMMPILHNSSL